MAHRVKGCCPLDCQDTCAWEAHVEDGQVVRTVGVKDHPITRGVLCAKVNDYERRIDAPDRVLHPLRLSGPKGSGRFERIGWDEALDTIATRFSSIIRESGAQALLPVHYLGSMGVVQRRALLRLFHALGTSQPSGNICAASAVSLVGSGHRLGFDPEDLPHSQLVLLWGANLLTTSHHHWHFVQRAREENGARIVCIDPIRTRTARQCDQHLMLRPGSDTVLAASLAQVMLHERLVDLAHASQFVSDLDAFAEKVHPWTPERAAEVCGLAPNDIVDLAQQLASARPASIRMGVGPMQSRSGDSLVRLLSALSILGGHERHRGGGLLAIAFPALNGVAAGRPDLAPPGYRTLDMARLGEHLTDASLQPQVRGLMVWGHNPAVTQPDSGRVRLGLAREDLFTVVVEHFLTDTARYADIVLPSTTQYEHFDIVGAWGHHYISINEPAIEPRGEALSHGEIMRRLAARLGLDHPALRESDEEIAASALPKNVSVEALRDKGWIKMPAPTGAAGTPAPKLSISVDVLAPPGPPADGRLQLLTPKSHYFLNSTFANMPRQRTAMKRPTLQMNLADANRLGLADGQRVRVRNEQGVVNAWLLSGRGIAMGCTALEGKWWDDAGEGAVSNVLSPSAWSPSGQPNFNETFVLVDAAP